MECNQRNIKIILEDNVCDATDCIDIDNNSDIIIEIMAD